MLGVIIFFLFVGFIGRWLFYSRKNKKVPNKVIIPFIAIAFLMLGNQTALDSRADVSKDIEEENEQLIEKIADLEEENNDIQDKFDGLENKLQALSEENTDLKAENKDLSDGSKTWDKEIDSLESDNKDLKKENEKQAEKISSLENNNDTLQKELEESKSTSQETSSSETSNSNGNNNTTNNNKSSTANTAQESEECNIKGSESGIYHTPGSTYYSRTTNVVEWFCSTEEAVNAGYRAPKR